MFPCAFACAVLDAPDNAVSVPANADVDQLGRFDAKGEVTDCTGFDEKCVSSYSGVSEGESRNRWWDMLSSVQSDDTCFRGA